jgi:hypothetical protein
MEKVSGGKTPFSGQTEKTRPEKRVSGIRTEEREEQWRVYMDLTDGL